MEHFKFNYYDKNVQIFYAGTYLLSFYLELTFVFLRQLSSTYEVTNTKIKQKINSYNDKM